MNYLSQNNLRNFILSQAKPPVIICIGSSKVTGDCFGPLTGQLLSDFLNVPSPIYGSLENPIHALNITDKLYQIKLCHPDRKIIAVDSALSDMCEIGSIRFFDGPIKPGLALGKKLPEVGDFSVTATVGNKNRSELFNADYGKIYSLSLRAAYAVHNAYCNTGSRNSSAANFILRR